MELACAAEVHHRVAYTAMGTTGAGMGIACELC